MGGPLVPSGDLAVLHELRRLVGVELLGATRSTEEGLVGDAGFSRGSAEAGFLEAPVRTRDIGGLL
eukprot:9331297-Lingulodinium_polyedra.AAC.1